MKQGLLVRVPDYTAAVVEFNDDNCGEVISEKVNGLFSRLTLKSLEVDLWVNDNGIALDLPLNVWATAVASQYFGKPYRLFGNVFVTGLTDFAGYSHGINEDDLEPIIETVRDCAAMYLEVRDEFNNL
jgi:hypothetical protein